MGWLQTPDFKNPGFDSGDVTDWWVFPYGNDIAWVWEVKRDNGDNYLNISVSQADVALGLIRIGQDLQLSSATGVVFRHRCTGYTALDALEIWVYIVADEPAILYKYKITGEYSWTQTYVDISSYQDRHKLYVEVVYYGKEMEVGFDDIHLVGPGF